MGTCDQAPQTGLGDPGRLLEGVLSLLKGEESWKDACGICVMCEASVGGEGSVTDSTAGMLALGLISSLRGPILPSYPPIYLRTDVFICNFNCGQMHIT